MLKMKSSTKNPKNFNSPSFAWVSTEELTEKIEKDKPTKSSKFKIKTKKSSNKSVEIIDSEWVEESPRLKPAFVGKSPRSAEDRPKHNLDMENGRRSLKKSDVDISRSIDKSEELVTVHPLVVESGRNVKKQEEFGDIIETVISSDESSGNSEKETKSNKKSKSKIKEKKVKSNIEYAEIFYFKENGSNRIQMNEEDDFPWTVHTYKPDMNGDQISEEEITLFQIFNILSHPVYKDKTLILDVRVYGNYQSKNIFGAKHISEYNSKDQLVSLEKVKSEKYSMLILLCPANENDIPIQSNEEIKIFKLKFSEDLESQLSSFFINFSFDKSKSLISFTCFDFGNVLFAENFELSSNTFTDIQLNSVVTDNSRMIYHKLSESNCNKAPSVISITYSDVKNGEYSEKGILNTKLKNMLDHLSSDLFEGRRVMILIEDSENLSLLILTLILMYKNHWCLHDCIYCITFVRCMKFNIKQNNLNILKNFEKLFFGKRLYSGGIKSKFKKEFAIEL